MDLYAYANSRMPHWQRLQELTRKRVLSGSESDEFAHLYQLAAADLARLRSQAPSPDLVLRLSAVVGEARAKITAPVSTPSRTITKFFLETLPLAVYRIRWWILFVSLACILVFGATLLSYVLQPATIESLGSAAQLDDYARVAFSAYYVEYENADFTALVWSNNAWIALLTVASGFTGIVPIYILWANSVSIGQAGAILESRDMLDVFFQLILPHGQLELCAVFVAGAAGLKIFWTLISPGPRPRTLALAQEGRQTLLVGVAMVFALFVSGLVEGFVTPSGLPWPVKIAIGSAALLAFWFWVIYFGRRAIAVGSSADLDESTVGWTEQYA